jgi:sarcosine oxidase/L-pipecolate oxidase
MLTSRSQSAKQQGVPTKATGIGYVRASFVNALALAEKDTSLAGRIRELPDSDAIRAAVGTGGTSGSWGFVNDSAGWADAEKSMDWLYERVQQTGRVSFVHGTAARLTHDSSAVTGAELKDGRVVSGDLVMLAAGAWSPTLLDLSGTVTATGQVLGYISLTEEEQTRLGGMPTLLNLSTGMFVIPPANRLLKAARHAYGYLNPVSLPAAPLPSSPDLLPSSSPVVVSVPRTASTEPPFTTIIPADGAAALRQALHDMVPLPGLGDRPWLRTRLCWYADTPTGDFLVSPHPHWQRLFVATGDSGHAFKFLPVLGDRVVDIIMGQCPEDLREKWAWPERTAEAVVVTSDGSRGDKPGLILDEELQKSSSQE